MTFRGLAWRVGLPFLLLVIAETVGLAFYMSSQIAAEERARLERLAATNAVFIKNTSLPPGERLAADLQRATGFDVYFRHGRVLTPPAPAALARALEAAVADGAARRSPGFEVVAVDLHADGSGAGQLYADQQMLVVREVGSEFLDSRIVRVLSAFWLLAIVIAWLAVRGLVRPLRSLAAKLPSIESDAALEVPEADRRDEIGDVARAFLATRQALQDERDQRARMEKLAALGRMTASLAHEIQNPVAAIKMHAQLLRDGDSAEVAEVVEHEAARIEDLVHQWLFLSRPEPPALGVRDLGELIDELARSLRRRFEHARVTLRVTLAAQRQGDLTIAGDGKRLRHVFSNLFGNAIQAMPHGGPLDVRFTDTGDGVRVVVRDHGAGFSAAALARVGEFFFSEKEGGMGIGLGVAREIVVAHGGTLRAGNAADGGAEVTVWLPRRPPAQGGATSAGVSAAEGTGGNLS